MKPILVVGLLTFAVSNVAMAQGVSPDDVHQTATGEIESISNSPVINFCRYRITYGTGMGDYTNITKRVARWSDCPKTVRVGYNKYTKEWRLLD